MLELVSSMFLYKESEVFFMTFTLRPSTVAISEGLLKSYQRNPKMALLTVKTGGGKTYGAIHTFGQLFKKATLLVFTTSKVAQSKQWEKSVKDYNQVMGTELTIICNNYEKLTSQPFLNKLAKKLTVATKFGPVCMVLDEVHRIKLSGSGKLSKRAKMIIQLAKQPYIKTTLGLSATAFSNSYLDVATYLIIAGYYNSKTQYLREHVKRFDMYHAPIVTDWTGQISRSAFKNPEKIDAEIASISTYIDTSQYLPTLISHHKTFKLQNNEQTIYNKISRDFFAGKSFDYPIQARMAQERLLARYLYWQKDLYLLDIIKNRAKGLYQKQAPILIFYQYAAVFNHLKNMLHAYDPDLPLAYVNGTSHLNNFDKPIADNAIYLVQYEAGGEGLDWQWSNISVFYEAPVRYEKFVQAKGRNMRNQSIMPYVYHFELEYADTLDQERWDTNRQKRDFTKQLSEKTFMAKSKN